MQNYNQQPPEPIKKYQGNSFSINLPVDWQDKTIFTLTGPVTDGIQHNTIINIDYDVKFETVLEFAELQLKGMENELKGCRLLKQGTTQLANGLSAYQAIFCWYPTNELRVYQHQLFVLHDKKGFKLTAIFTKKTRKTLGPQVWRMMLSFEPK